MMKRADNPVWKKHMVLVTMGGLLLTVAGLWSTCGEWLPYLPQWLDVGVELDEKGRSDARSTDADLGETAHGRTAALPADYVFIMPGDERIRPFVAAAMVRTGLARGILIPENQIGPEVIDGALVPSHEVIRRVLRLRGVPPESIQLLKGATANTQDDVAVLVRFLKQQPSQRVAVVTSGYHTRRSRLLLNRATRISTEYVVFISAPVDEFQVNRWWKSEAGFLAITSEYVKLAVSALLSTDAAWCVGCLFVAALLWLLGKRHFQRRTNGRATLRCDTGPGHSAGSRLRVTVAQP